MRRTLLLGATLVCGALAATGAVLALTADRETRVRANVFVNADAPIDANNSPTVARNPRRPDNLAVAYRVDRPLFSAALAWSEDGGRTWQPTALPLPEGLDRPFAPDLAFGPDGTLHVVYVNLTGTGNVPDNLWHSSSTDGGRSLSPPTRVAGRLSFQPRIAVDGGGTIHLTWLRGSEVGLLKLVGPPSPIVAARSTDGGRTFSQPVRVSDESRVRVGAASPVIDSRGELVVLYQDFKTDRRDFENLPGPAWEDPFALVVTRSADGGASFSPGVELESNVVPTKRFLVFLPEFPSLAAGPDGVLYATWADGRNGDEDVFLRRSGDGGRTWGDPVRVNDNPARDGTAQYLPRVAVAPGGRVDVVFLDRRRDRRNVMTDAFLASSPDGAGGFQNVRLSSESFDSRVGPSASVDLPIDFGTRLGLTSRDGDAFAAWTDTRIGTDVTGRQDVVAAAVRIPPPLPVLARTPVIVGLLLLGILSLVAWRASATRRRPEPAAPAASDVPVAS